MFKKRIRCAVILLISMLSLTVIFTVFIGVTFRHNRGSETMKVLAGDVGLAEGIEICLYEEDDSYHWYEVLSPTSKYQNIYTMNIDGTEVITNAYRETLRSNLYTYKPMWAIEYAQEYVEGCHEIKGSEISVDVYVRPYGLRNITVKDYVTFGDEDKFLYYYNKMTNETYEAFSLQFENEYLEKKVCRLGEKDYLYLWEEPRYEYQCNYSNYGSTQSTSASKSEKIWGFEEACENVPDRWYVSKLKEFGMPEITMKVNKGIYCVGEDLTAENRTADCVFRMNDIAEDFSFLWMLPVEEENALSIIGQKGNNLVEYRYFVEQNTVTEYVLWEAGEELTEWFESVKENMNVDIMKEGERTYLCYSESLYENAGGDLVRLMVFERGNKVFEGEIRLQKEYAENLQDFSLNTNVEYDRYFRTREIEIRKKQ